MAQSFNDGCLSIFAFEHDSLPTAHVLGKDAADAYEKWRPWAKGEGGYRYMDDLLDNPPTTVRLVARHADVVISYVAHPDED